jgi:methylthioribose-1-phosphate isomerase
VTCWELAAAGVPHFLVADAAAPSLIAAGEVDAVLVAADRVTANGDVAATIGTYPLAVVAARHGIPFLVCAPATSIDPDTATGADVVIGTKQPGELDRVGDVAIAPRGTDVRVPLHDVTPAELVTSYVTGDGLRMPPFEPVTEPAAAPQDATAQVSVDAPASAPAEAPADVVA